MCDFGEGRVHAIKHMFVFFFVFLQEVSASHEEQSSP